MIRQSTRPRWRVRQLVPMAAPRLSPCTGTLLERVRGPQGRDRGLYVLRTPDGISRIAIVRASLTADVAVPHVVRALEDAITLGVTLARYWPTKHTLPDAITYVDAVGDFAAAVRFACQAARRIAAGDDHA